MAARKWAQQAVKRPGAYRASVRRRYGARGFTKAGDIRMSVINRDLKRRPADRIYHMALAAKNLRKLSRKRRK